MWIVTCATIESTTAGLLRVERTVVLEEHPVAWLIRQLGQGLTPTILATIQVPRSLQSELREKARAQGRLEG